MSAGWMNGFVEIVLGSAIIIPIAVGYLGIDGMKDLLSEGGGLGLGFKTLPYLFEQWGGLLGVIAGVAWFGLLFFAGVTSSLAMGTPVMGFLKDEFNWKEKNAAWAFGLAVFLLGLPTVLFFNNGVFDEYDYWAGTVSLVVFALFEIILFAWIFGMKKGWDEINKGADIRVPVVFKFIIKYVTPVLLGWVFINSIPDIVSTLNHDKSKEKIAFYQNISAMQAKSAEQQSLLLKKSDFKPEYLNSMAVSDDQLMKNKLLTVPTYLLIKKERELSKIISDTAYKTEKIDSENKTMLFKNISRVFLLVLWLGIAYLVYIASRNLKLKQS
jgi:hypothetical protein